MALSTHEQNPNVTALDNRNDFTLFIAISDQKTDEFTKQARCAYYWAVYQGCELIDSDAPALGSKHEGWSGDSLVPQTASALSRLPEASTVYVVSDVKWFTDLLNSGAEQHVARRYRKADKKTPLAQADDWRRLDEIVLRAGLKVSAGRPRTDEEVDRLAGAKLAAERQRRNIGLRPKEWDT